MPEGALRIAMLTHSVNPRGGVVHALELAEALQRAGHRVTLMAPAAPGSGFFRDTTCEVSLAPLAPCRGGLQQQVRARIDAYVEHLGGGPDGRSVEGPAGPLGDAGFDLFHAQDSISGNALATLASQGRIGGFVRTVHHLDDFADPQLAAWQQRAVAAATQRLCVSQLWCDTLRREHGLTADLVPNGVDLERYQPLPRAVDVDIARQFGLRPGAPLVLAVGGIEERKNTLRLLEAFLRLRQRRPHAQLVVAGGASVLDHDVYASAFRSALAESVLAQDDTAVVITGAVADAAMPALYRLADVLAMPSLREGFGLAALEALASGTPAVVSRRAPFTEHFGDADVSWADPLDAGSIADALAHALARPRQPPPAVCRRFSWDASAQRHLQLYHAALGAHAAP